ncbi:MAG: ABC transporter permease, partial [Ilumatobacteraceae bacterium]
MSLAATPPPPSVADTPPSTPVKALAVPGPLQLVLRVFGTLWTNSKARIGLVILGLMILVAVLAPVLAPHDPHSTDFT